MSCNLCEELATYLEVITVNSETGEEGTVIFEDTQFNREGLIRLYEREGISFEGDFEEGEGDDLPNFLNGKKIELIGGDADYSISINVKTFSSLRSCDC